MKLAPAFFIGFLAGLRAVTPPMAVAWALRSRQLAAAAPMSWTGTRVGVEALTLFAGVELVGDKLPMTPARTDLPGLAARLLSGGFCGLCLGQSRGQGSIRSAVIGALGGVAGCFGGYHLRKSLVRRLQIKDAYVALAEDAITVLGTRWLLHRAAKPASRTDSTDGPQQL